MILPLLLSSAVALADPAQASAAAKPLREVVYSASYSDTHAQNTTSYYGNQQAEAAQSDRGTITVDIMQVAGDMLGLRVTEQWASTGTPHVYTGNVGADCSVNFAPGSIQLVTRNVVGFFCRTLGTQHAYTLDEQWVVNGPAHTGIADSYDITKVDGASVTIHENRVSNTSTVRAGDLSGESNVVYKPSALVATSGSYVLRVAAGSYATTEEDTILMRFDRTSDSLDSSP